MSNSSNIDFDQDYVIIHTEVTVGKSYKSRGWALSRADIHDWIPVEEFERNCKVIINNICSDAILRFNPRLFYESDELSYYLEELYDNGFSRYKIPMKIRVSKDDFYSNVDSRDYSPSDIETLLRVGKSYSSGGWQLSKEVVSLLFPLSKYEKEYSIYIDEIHSNAKLNFQFRLFYKSDNLSEYLEKLYYEDANAKIPAKIIFERDSSDDMNNIEQEDVLNDSNENEGSYFCTFCGKSYNIPNKLSDVDNKFSNLCQECIEKIITLDTYNLIKNSSLSKFIKKEYVEDKIESNFNIKWELLIKYNFLTSFGDLYKLNGNEVIENNYSKYLSDNTYSKLKPKKRNRDKILKLIENEDENKDTCVVCGTILKDSEIGKCGICGDKSLAIQYLQKIVTKIPYGKGFTKLNLLDIGINSIEADLFIEKLLKYDLFIKESDIFYKLNDVDMLNEFIEKYSDSPYQLQINYINNDSNILKISKEDLTSEEKIDSLIKWKNYGDFISFKKGQYGYISVQFMQDGVFVFSKGFGTSYEAKIEAIHYLKSLGKVELMVDNDIKLEFK